MRKIHLTLAQKAAILALIDRFDKRPSFVEYEKGHAELKKLQPEVKPKRKDIPFTSPGYESGEVKLRDGFDARKYLPAGWAVVSTGDSGGNHVIRDAAGTMWRAVWSYWAAAGAGSRFERPDRPCALKEAIDNLYD